MKIYKLLDNPQNRDQHNLFLEQYDSFDWINDPSDDIQRYLDENKYRLTVEWVNIENEKIEGFTDDSGNEIEVSQELFDRVVAEAKKEAAAKKKVAPKKKAPAKRKTTSKKAK